MSLALRFRSAVLLAASAAASPAFSQALPPGAVPGATMPTEILSAPGVTADPFAGGAYAVPTGAPISVAFGDPAAISGPVISGPTPSGGPVYMAPQVIGSPGCNCNQGGAPLMDPGVIGGAPVGSAYEIPLGEPSFGGTPMYGNGGMPMYGDPNCGMPDTGCCLTDGCLLGGCLDGLCSPCLNPCDPCGTVCPPVCDPCQQPGVMTPGVTAPGGVYHGAGGAPRRGWSAGFSWVFLKPFYGSNSAFSVITPAGGSTIANTREFDHSLDLSPRVFVEFVGQSDTGIRATWFGFDNDADAISANAPAGGLISRPIGTNAFPGETVRATSGFDLDTIDIDVTNRFRVRRSLFNLGGGVRWAGYEHNYQSTVTGPAVGTAVGNASRQFHGIGPTLFAEWRRPLGTSQFSLLANVRGSMLYGSSKSSTYTQAFGTAASFNSRNDDFVAIGESQLGGEWSAWISRRTVLFVQAAWETQYWLGVGTAFDRNDDLGLFGFNTTVGLEW